MKANGDYVVTARSLTKTYKFHEQGAGLWIGLKSVFNRQYQTRLAVDGIDFQIARGEIVGLLGPNGAGKTTTLKMLSGLLHPTSGELDVLGYRPAELRPDYLKRISLVMGQKTMLWWDVPAMDTLLLHKQMYDLTDEDFSASVTELAELLDVTDLLSVQVRKLSLGERMRMELLTALLHRPEILFLDEPTIGLDVVATARVREFLIEINRRRNTTILVTSHDMDDIEALCERVLIVDHGRIWYDGQLADLVLRTRPRKRVRATYAESIATANLSALDVHGEVTRESDRVLRLEIDREALPVVLQQLATVAPLVDVDVADAEVEEIIRELFTRRKDVV